MSRAPPWRFIVDDGQTDLGVRAGLASSESSPHKTRTELSRRSKSPMSERKDSATDRTRRHPEERFAPDAQAFDLDLTAIELARETTTGHARHRQKTLYRHGGSSLALFLFEAGAELREH